MLASFLGESGNIFFPKLDFDNDQVFFKDIALDYLKEKGFEPVIVKSEIEAKEFKISEYPKKYPIYLFKTDTSGEKLHEEFYTDSEDYNIDNYLSLGYIQGKEEEVSFEDVVYDFEEVFNNLNSNKSDIVDVINKYVPNFKHIETGKNLDQKM